jgi:transcriptional regulator with XRE-family HTH domain
MNLRELVSKNIKLLRLKAGLSQSQLADRVDKSVRYISALENQAQNVTLETLQALADGLGVSVRDLFVDGTDQNPAQLKKAKADFDSAIILLNRYRQLMERQISPPRRTKLEG